MVEEKNARLPPYRNRAVRKCTVPFFSPNACALTVTQRLDHAMAFKCVQDVRKAGIRPHVVYPAFSPCRVSPNFRAEAFSRTY